jgi:Mature-T-Cell Proliferation I type
MSSVGPGFVYRGAGKKIAADAEISLRKCRAEACDIQWCLSRRKYNVDSCRDVIARWELCCEVARAGEHTHGNAVSPS